MNSINKLYALIAFAVVSLISNASFGQQTPTFSEYNYNPFIINSAYAGLTQNTEVSLSNSGFFNDFEGSPSSLSLSGHGQMNRGKVGLGAGLIRDKIGVTTSTSFFAAYSYKIFFDFESNRPYWQHYSPGVISFGITGGVQQYQDNLTELGITNDPNFAQDINTTIPTIGLSFLFNHASFYAGFSAPNIMGNSLATNKDVKLSTPVYGYFGYRILSDAFRNIMIKPNVLIKHEKDAPMQIDFNLATSFKNKFEIGVGYRTSSSVNLLAGIYLFNNLRFIYTYNIASNNSPLGNSHGIILSIQFKEGYAID
ncbi:type IX secretion system membrane protein PorP/SprF [Algibacter amylolyticus]|uniref:Type IX secretion system membrane protein PorP/SprF n=1 Tax=Algibacter amylolyticus TaxID=1608400 RepID=A0A5M7AVX7_9FLAO|nr:PorP/SprF family type IX secretion system membrane protein [Algibacter amylolyticus]KAA5820840.1 type IX secretion system membrane protein PorP/SprF [Algibacter amylolyticus]MBB5269917.1 type IX secretion system PorP/SprF family membrane protein [Algibacter amylolyticus]TSJ71915.1 type IX secretion system membrane protein PorP/SprF [Algibacter amylolyticus]